MRKILSISLLLIFLLQSFSRVWIVISFKLNQEHIAKELCINRNNPEMQCNGKCYLMQKLKAEEENRKKSTPEKGKEQKEVLFCCDTPAPLFIRFTQVVRSPFYEAVVPSGVVMSTFHPPRMETSLA